MFRNIQQGKVLSFFGGAHKNKETMNAVSEFKAFLGILLLSPVCPGAELGAGKQSEAADAKVVICSTLFLHQRVLSHLHSRRSFSILVTKMWNIMPAKLQIMPPTEERITDDNCIPQPSGFQS